MVNKPHDKTVVLAARLPLEEAQAVADHLACDGYKINSLSCIVKSLCNQYLANKDGPPGEISSTRYLVKENSRRKKTGKKVGRPKAKPKPPSPIPKPPPPIKIDEPEAPAPQIVHKSALSLLMEAQENMKKKKESEV